MPALDLLAYARTLVGDFAEARALYTRALAIAESESKTRLETIARVENMGMLEFSAGDHPAAQRWFRRAHDALVEHHGRDARDNDLQRICENIATSQVKKAELEGKLLGPRGGRRKKKGR